MREESGRYENRIHQPLYNPKSRSQGRYTEIGEARVVSTLLGKARVRIVRNRGSGRRLGLWVALTGLVLALAVWLKWGLPEAPEPMLVMDLPLESSLVPQGEIEPVQAVPALTAPTAIAPPAQERPASMPVSPALRGGGVSVQAQQGGVPKPVMPGKPLLGGQAAPASAAPPVRVDPAKPVPPQSAVSQVVTPPRMPLAVSKPENALPVDQAPAPLTIPVVVLAPAGQPVP